MKALVIAECSATEVTSATLSTVTAAKQLATQVDLLIIGHALDEVVKQAATIEGIDKVLVIDAPVYEHPLAHEVAEFLVPIAKDYNYLLTAANTHGKNLLPRLAALLDITQTSDIINIQTPDTFERPIYAGDAIALVKNLDAIKALTVRPTAFNAAKFTANSAAITHLEAPLTNRVGKFLELSADRADEPDLASAKIVVAGGRGLQSAENFALIRQLAQVLGAAVGATRAAVDANYIANDKQVGQTGKVIAPQLYIAIGISGAVQHLAGIKDSKVIVAINQDPNAPIFEVADYALVGDLFTIVPELIQAIQQL